VEQQKFTWLWDVSNGTVQVTDGKWTNGSTVAMKSADLECIQYAQDNSVLDQHHTALTGANGASIDPGHTVSFGTFSAGDAAQGVEKLACKIMSVTVAQ
jgi:hypothetical protein